MQLDDMVHRVRQYSALDEHDAVADLLDTLAGVLMQLGRIADACETVADVICPMPAEDPTCDEEEA